MKVRVIPPVVDEVAEAEAWYEAAREGLGAEYMYAVQVCISRIQGTPEQFPIWDRGRTYRRALVGRFPYAIYFVMERPDLIIVYAVAHTRRRPGYWTRRRSLRLHVR